jgi:hypothetical protein
MSKAAYSTVLEDLKNIKDELGGGDGIPSTAYRDFELIKGKLANVIGELIKTLSEGEYLRIAYHGGGQCHAYVDKNERVSWFERDCEGSWSGIAIGLESILAHMDTPFRVYELCDNLFNPAIYHTDEEGLLVFKERRPV